MTDNKGKTKAAILHELESIKGLLRDEDDIPILQEIIDGDSDHPRSSTSNRPMAQRDLDELHNAFQALSHTISNNPGNNSPDRQNSQPKPMVSNDGGLLNPIVRQQMHAPHQPTDQPTHQLKPSTNATPKPTPTKQQTPLFAAEDFDQDYLQEDNADLEMEKPGFANRISESSPVNYSEKNSSMDNLGATRNFDGANDYPVSKSIVSTNNRTTLAKASGENPFLPQHIRARLHGNNPPPLFDLSTVSQTISTPLASTPAPMPSPISAINTKTSTDPLPNRQNLVQAVIASVLPQIEQELRQRLQPMTEDELLHLLNQEE